jgi:hypothetical protein
MTLFQLPTSLVRSPWAQPFQQLVSIAQRELLLVSPFIKSESTDQILSNLQRRGALRLDAVGCILPVGRKVKTQAPGFAGLRTGWDKL